MRVSAANSWMQDLHPKKQAPLRTMFNKKADGVDSKQLGIADDNYNSRVCFSKAMLGWRKRGDVWVGHKANFLGLNLFQPEKIYNMPEIAPVDLWRNYHEYASYGRGIHSVRMILRKAVYLTREGASRRRVLNREAIFDVMRDVGYDVESLFFEDYVDNVQGSHAVIRSAALVIGPHGAGFANILAMNEHASIIEFHSANFQRMVYGRMAKVLGIKYDYILVPEEDNIHNNISMNSKRDIDFWRHRDMNINVDELRNKLIQSREYLKEKSLW